VCEDLTSVPFRDPSAPSRDPQEYVSKVKEEIRKTYADQLRGFDDYVIETSDDGAATTYPKF
jgi:hypothetical protein